MIQIHTLFRYDNCDSENLSDFLTVTFSVVDIFWLPRILLYPGKRLALHFIHKTPMRTSKSYVNSYWQQIQEWEQNSSAVNNSRPHSQWPQPQSEVQGGPLAQSAPKSLFPRFFEYQLRKFLSDDRALICLTLELLASWLLLLVFSC